MHYAVVHTRGSQGLEAPPVTVEVHLSSGLPGFTIVGMPETAVRESKDRVRSAILSSHFEFPDRRITVNLAPADLPKGGGRFDLPIALGMLAASRQLPGDCLQGVECFGELALNGELRATRGAVAATMAATGDGNRVALAHDSASLAARVPGSRLLPARDLLSLCAMLRDRAGVPDISPLPGPAGTPGTDLADVAGQEAARRALEITAAGGHNLLLYGPPGTGKSLLAGCLPGILPEPAPDELLTVLALHDLHGEQPDSAGRPFRAPHHSASGPALVGGGPVPQPGEVSLAHGGVLFLDELPEFSRHTLDMLREPLESGEITLARARCRIRYPARFQLVAAMNPCPCGYAGDSLRNCRCSPAQRQAYGGRVSGPLLDRIDLRVPVPRSKSEDLLGAPRGEDSASVRARVQACCERQLERQGCRNATLTGQRLFTACAIDEEGLAHLSRAINRLGLSARAVHRCLRLARTIADLAGDDTVSGATLSEALGYRQAPDETPA